MLPQPKPKPQPANLVAGCQRHSSSSGTDATPKSADRESTCAAAICGRPNDRNIQFLLISSVGRQVVKLGWCYSGNTRCQSPSDRCIISLSCTEEPCTANQTDPRMLATIAVMRKRESSSHETSSAYIISTFTICIISILSIGIICIDSRSIACTPGIKACYLMMV